MLPLVLSLANMYCSTSFAMFNIFLLRARSYTAMLVNHLTSEFADGSFFTGMEWEILIWGWVPIDGQIGIRLCSSTGFVAKLSTDYF